MGTWNISRSGGKIGFHFTVRCYFAIIRENFVHVAENIICIFFGFAVVVPLSLSPSLSLFLSMLIV